MGIKCCKDCQDRHIGCHGTCKKYLDEVKAENEKKERLRKEKKGQKRS